MKPEDLIGCCRLCGDDISSSLWVLQGMPKAAQNFLDVGDELKTDKLDLDIHQCGNCGLVQLNIEPVHYYREVIRAAAFSDEMAEFRRRQFREFISSYGIEGQRAVEVGCGGGEYLALLQDSGLRMTGIEYGEVSVRSCQDKGFDVRRGFIEDSTQPPTGGEFAACFMFNFLEHLPRPNSTLRGIANHLAVNGVGLIEVPNFDMIIKENMFTEFCSDHLLYFTRDTFTQILLRNGFEVIECKPIWYDYILSATVRKRRPISVANFEQALDDLSRSLNNFIGRFEPRRVAIWGAGHQALAVMAVAQLAERIPYVIDSASFKQGKITPATNIPIVPPDILEREPPEAILVMAAGYSDEVVRTIRMNFGNRFELAVLRGQHLDLNP